MNKLDYIQSHGRKRLGGYTALMIAPRRGDLARQDGPSGYLLVPSQISRRLPLRGSPIHSPGRSKETSGACSAIQPFNHRLASAGGKASSSDALL